MSSTERNAPVPLTQVLRRVQSYPCDHALFVPPAVDWGLDTPCLVLDPDDVFLADADDDSPVVDGRPFEYRLPMDAVRGVVENARARLDDPSATVLCDALSYYDEHDAFPLFDGSADEGRSGKR